MRAKQAPVACAPAIRVFLSEHLEVKSQNSAEKHKYYLSWDDHLSISWICLVVATFQRVWANIQSTWTNRGAFEIWSRQATSASQLELSICALLTSLTSSHSPVTRIGRSRKTFKDYFLVMRWDITFCHWCWLPIGLSPLGLTILITSVSALSLLTLMPCHSIIIPKIEVNYTIYANRQSCRKYCGKPQTITHPHYYYKWMVYDGFSTIPKR